jgi:hypothetical protein
LAFATVLADELYPLWTAAEIAIGGLKFLAIDIGVSMAFMGAVGMPSQIFLYPMMQRKFGLLPLFKYSLMVTLDQSFDFRYIWSSLQHYLWRITFAFLVKAIILLCYGPFF